MRTRRDVKSVNQDYRVGGPAGSKTMWLQPLIGILQNEPFAFWISSAFTHTEYSWQRRERDSMKFWHSVSLSRQKFACARRHHRTRTELLAQAGDPICRFTPYRMERVLFATRSDSREIFIFPRRISWSNSNTRNTASLLRRIGRSPIFLRRTGGRWVRFMAALGCSILKESKKPAYFAYQFLNRLGQTELQNLRLCFVGMPR